MNDLFVKDYLVEVTKQGLAWLESLLLLLAPRQDLILPVSDGPVDSWAFITRTVSVLLIQRQSSLVRIGSDAPRFISTHMIILWHALNR